jgi:uncharacterized protein (TIGR02266 family)
MAGDQEAKVERDQVKAAIERREQIRVEAGLKVTYKSIDELVEAYTENISRGGLFVHTTDYLPIGAVVQLQLQLPGDETAFDAIARVAHIVASDDNPETGKGMGLEFVDVGGAPLADRISRFLAAEGKDEDVPPSPAAVSAEVLVVDDDEAWRVKTAQTVREAGHRAVCAKNGLDALRRAVETPPDLIVTDIQMPALDGWQFIRLVRARPGLADIPVVLVAGRINDEERLRAYQLGVSDFVTKPFDNEELAFAVQRVLERARAYPRRVASGGTLRGDLSLVSLGRVLTLLASERREGILLIVGSEEIASLHLREGAVIRVDLADKYDDLEGVARLYHVLDWVSGRFEFSLAKIAGSDEINATTATAILNHSQLIDDEDETAVGDV